jgi:hypothetical protein
MVVNTMQMASESESAHSAPRNAKLTSEQMRRGIRRLEACIGALEAFDPAATLAMPEDIALRAATLKESIESALDQTFGRGTVEYQRYSVGASFDVPFSIDYGYSRDVTIEGLRNARTRSLDLLPRAVALLKGGIESSKD